MSPNDKSASNGRSAKRSSNHAISSSVRREYFWASSLSVDTLVAYCTLGSSATQSTGNPIILGKMLLLTNAGCDFLWWIAIARGTLGRRCRTSGGPMELSLTQHRLASPANPTDMFLRTLALCAVEAVEGDRRVEQLG